MNLDPATTDLLRFLAGSAIVSALVSGLISEWRTRSAERRALVREEQAERRAEERERKREDRDRWLQRIDQTEGDYLGSMQWLMLYAAGAPQEQRDATRWGPEHFPQSQWYLIAEESLLEQVFAFRGELEARELGQGFSRDDANRMGALQGHVVSRLELQRERIRNGQEPLWPDAGWMKNFIERAGAERGLPPGYVPRINPDA